MKSVSIFGISSRQRQGPCSGQSLMRMRDRRHQIGYVGCDDEEKPSSRSKEQAARACTSRGPAHGSVRSDQNEFGRHLQGKDRIHGFGLPVAKFRDQCEVAYGRARRLNMLPPELWRLELGNSSSSRASQVPIGAWGLVRVRW